MTINTYLSNHNDLEGLKKYFPEPENIKDIDGRWGCQAKIPIYQLVHGDYEYLLAHTWKKLYHDMVQVISKNVIGRNDYFIFRIIPDIRRDFMDDTYCMQLVAELLVAPTRNTVIPTFTYDNIHRPIEWRCGHCRMPNSMEAKYCGEKHEHAAGCGAPRALLIQEIA